MSYELDARTPAATATYRIDPMRDRLLALRKLAQWHFDRTGEHLHRTVPYRWATRGVDGVRLPTVRIGSGRYTSEEAIQWWTRALEAKDPSHG